MSEGKPETERRHVHFHVDSEATEQREHGIAIECPFCGAWKDAKKIQRAGCVCGADVRLEMAFIDRGEDMWPDG